ncbi:glycoside hydrolase family 43 protein [Lentisphaerota bacterium WC36G]|nr:glycoside hydrolase family 43 protein [Lentisphaerae bacterium WC36]
MNLKKIVLMTISGAVISLTSCLNLHTQPEKKNYLFSYFKGNGNSGLHLAYSRDGLNWKNLKNGQSFNKPEVGDKIMRDPCIIQGPDGVFHMVFTVSWWSKQIGIAHSNDLINWSKHQVIPVMEHEKNARNCWAPEIFYDDVNEQYIIFWATTIKGKFPETAKTGDNGLNHRMYYTTTKNFKTYTPTKLFYDPGFNVIDSTIVKDSSNNRYVMFLKDETRHPAKKDIRMATAKSPIGPWSAASAPISKKNWVEGPTAIKIGDTWYVYYDAYGRGHFEGIKSKDMKIWTSINKELKLPKGIRHGTVFAVSDKVLEKLLQEK